MRYNKQAHLVVWLDPETVKSYLNNRCRGLPNVMTALRPPVRVKGATKRRIKTKGAGKRRVDPSIIAKTLKVDCCVDGNLTESMENYQLVLILGTEFRVKNDIVVFVHPEAGDVISFKTKWVLRVTEKETGKVLWER